MDAIASRAPTGPNPTTGMAGTAFPTGTPRLIEPSMLTQDEIRRIVLDLIG